ncbi:MAG: peptidase M48 [Elioraea sp.]|jgi:predicted Zn-dependent protease|nr:MAG: peptidase M48 [Elioraea sp.]
MIGTGWDDTLDPMDRKRGRFVTSLSDGAPAAPAYAHRRRDLIAAGASVLTAMALGLPLGGCQQNPALGRSQLILVSEEELEQMSNMAERDIRRRTGVLRDPARQRRLEQLADRLGSVEDAPRPRRGFRPELLDDRSVNAFVLPNGYSGYYDGLWRFTRGDDSELGLVMGHEMGHLAGRHAQERVSQQLALSIGAVVVGTAAGAAVGRRYSPAIGAALGLGVALGGAAFSRSHEYEADRLGLLYAARAGYDPEAGQRFWDRMEAQEGRSGGPSFLSTHPSYGDRRERLARLVREDPEIVAALRAKGRG